jgi:hypothetical protein
MYLLPLFIHLAEVAALKSGSSSSGSDSSPSPLPISPYDGFGDLDNILLGDGAYEFSGKSITTSRMFAVLFVSGCIYLNPLESGGEPAVYQGARVSHEEVAVGSGQSMLLFWFVLLSYV